MKLLQIDSSARAGSVTRRLTAKFAEEWKSNHPTGELIHRDLSTTRLPLITDDWSAARVDPSALSPSQRNYLVTSDALIEEVLAADIIVIGAPMYNFAIPSLLKAWIDQIVRVGKTFSYGSNGPQGLLGNRKVVVITARGGAYEKGTPYESFDFQEPICATFSDLWVSRMWRLSTLKTSFGTQRFRRWPRRQNRSRVWRHS
jgi:FMN-dependent NADH-azoreductase